MRYPNALLISCLCSLVPIVLVQTPAFAQDTVRIAYIDPLSGGGASIGEVGVKTFQFIADEINAKGGVLGKKLEIVPYDNKLNPQESLVQVQKAIDAGIRIVTQGNGSSVAAAISDFAAKFNERNPGKEFLFLNYAAVDPVLTNDKCNYWHFRWDANSDIKMEALTNYMKTWPSIKKLYLINQDYSFGQAVRAAAKTMLSAKRPDIQIVGDEMHPLLKITDFAPYVAKIKASGADSVVTGNWGQDFALLLKAAADAGLQVDWYTYYAGGTGGPTAIKQSGVNHRVFEISEGHANIPHRASQDFEGVFRAKYEIEGMKIDVFDGGDGFMRKDDHQFFQPMYIASFGERSDKEPFDEEKTGWGWRIITRLDAANTMLPTSCKMDRPS